MVRVAGPVGVFYRSYVGDFISIGYKLADYKRLPSCHYLLCLCLVSTTVRWHRAFQDTVQLPTGCSAGFGNVSQRVTVYLTQYRMSGQSITDRITAAQHSVTGSAISKTVCKATTHEIMGPKKKHLDCKYHIYW